MDSKLLRQPVVGFVLLFGAGLAAAPPPQQKRLIFKRNLFSSCSRPYLLLKGLNRIQKQGQNMREQASYTKRTPCTTVRVLKSLGGLSAAATLRLRDASEPYNEMSAARPPTAAAHALVNTSAAWLSVGMSPAACCMRK